MRKGIPTVGAALRRGVPRIECEEPSHAGFVAKNCRRVNVAAGNPWVRRQDSLGALKSP